MKKAITIYITLLFSGSLFSQIHKGDWLIGGTVSIGQGQQIGDASPTQKYLVISLKPDVGYFIVDKLAGGLQMDFRLVKYKGIKAQTSTSYYPFMRYYLLNANKKVNVLTEAAYGFGRDLNVVSFGAGPAIFLNPHTALEGILNYSSVGGKGISNRVGSISFNVGFQIHLLGK